MKTELLKKLRRKYPLSMLFNGKMLLRNAIDVRNDILLEVDRLKKKITSTRNENRTDNKHSR